MNLKINMMKNILVILLLSFSASTLSAQLEVKLNPVAAIFEVASVAVEYGLNDHFGLELDALVFEDGAGAWLLGKYYLSPNRGIDKFYVDAFIAIVDDQGGFGFGAGYKLVNNAGFLFDVGLGVGRSGDGVIPQGKLQIGYRF